MTDSVQVLPSGFRVLDANGDPVSGAQIRFWEGGTSTPKTVYSDQSLSTSLGSVVHTRSDGFPVSEEGGSTTVNIYIGSGLYDIDIVDADDVTIYPRKISQKGALDTSTFLTTDDASLLSIPVISTTDNLTLDADYNGKFVRGSTGSQSVTLTLDDAATLGDNWNVEISKAAAANTLRLVTTSSQIINFNGQAHTSLALSGLGEGLAIRCDGSAFYVGHYTPPLRGTVGVILIADRITSSPGGALPGQRYIVTAGFSTFEAEDIIEADAAGGFIEYTPAADCGWIAYVQDEDTYYAFKSAAWALLLPAATSGVAGIQENATQAEMETGTATDKTVTPGLQVMHPAHPKAWAVVTVSGGTPTLQTSYNIAGIADGGVGVLTITIATDFSGAHWAAIVTAEAASGGNAAIANVESAGKAAGSVLLRCYTHAGDALDPASFSFMGLGDFA